jgi:O-acetyl-ADP-ribose deacetylase (regulator of RNase III)
LAHSGGVAAAILREGGGKIQQESMNIISTNGQVKTGDCVYTGSGKLEAKGVKYIIHAVGPEYNKEKSTLFNSGQLYNTVYNTL